MATTSFASNNAMALLISVPVSVVNMFLVNGKW
jgi:hypothetical protein